MATIENPKSQDPVEHGQASPTATSNSASETELKKKKWSQRIYATLKEPGSALQIVIAAAIAIAIGISVSATTSDIPEAVPIIIEIPGTLWLRALRATGKQDLS